MTQPSKPLTIEQFPSSGTKVHIAHLFRQGLIDHFADGENSMSWLHETPAHVEAYRQGKELGKRIEAGELAFEREKKHEQTF